jgi:predicted RecB family nuclease
MTGKKNPMLSKSRFLAGLQCPLRLWYECYNPELASETSAAQQASFDMGHEVGQLATQLYPGGIFIEDDHFHHEEAVQNTLEAMGNPNIPAIYEAGFIYDGVRIRVDILERVGKGEWNLIEVKASTRPKDIHLPDVAVQYHVLKGSGLDVNQVFLMHLNNQYVYDGINLELEKLFSHTAMTRKALIYQEQLLPSLLIDLNSMLSEPEAPEMDPGRLCKNPYECAFRGHCTQDTPEHWVMNLPGINQKKLNELAAMGIDDIRDIPVSFPLSAIQKRIWSCVVKNCEYISPHLKKELLDVEYPVHFLDFETIGLAVPRYAGTRSYQTIPFQWSDHILYKNGTVEHREYLCQEDNDPRRELTQTLLHVLGSKGSIVTYTNYEEGIIKGLADEFQEYREKLLALLGRIRDLHKIISKNYYHPKFYGSFSIKSVLPALVPEMNYQNLEIQEGQIACLKYLRMIDSSTSAEEKEKIKGHLLSYCGYDTLAMMEIREVLLKKVRAHAH